MNKCYASRGKLRSVGFSMINNRWSERVEEQEQSPEDATRMMSQRRGIDGHDDVFWVIMINFKDSD